MTTTAFRVRRATTDDARAVAALAARTFPLACPPDASPAAIAEHVATQLAPERFRGWAASADHVLLVAEPAAAADEARVLGYALLVRAEPEGDDVPAALDHRAGPLVELSKIYVLPEAHGSGVAGVLMDAALDAAATLRPGSALAVWLGTNAANGRAQAFYRKHGFEVVGTRTYSVGGQQHDDVVMLRVP